jgi:hypothetical protein
VTIFGRVVPDHNVTKIKLAIIAAACLVAVFLMLVNLDWTLVTLGAEASAFTLS